MPITSIVRRPSKAPAGRRERRRTETRDRLFHSALKLFAERGYQETTVEAITEAADVGKGTFFNYFPTLPGISPKAPRSCAPSTPLMPLACPSAWNFRSAFAKRAA
ncbi:MAG: helix-turn-helix domain-containing protein [Candidatus Acidiferrales bacterium]